MAKPSLAVPSVLTMFTHTSRLQFEAKPERPDALPPVDRLAHVTQPTLVATGGIPDQHMGGLAPGFFDAAADAVASALPNAERRIVEGQPHIAEPTVFAATLERFFRSR